MNTFWTPKNDLMQLMELMVFFLGGGGRDLHQQATLTAHHPDLLELRPHLALPVGQIPHLRQGLPLGVPQAHLVQAHFELNEAVAPSGGLQARHEAALRVLRRQHAPEELRVRHGPAGQLGHHAGPSRTSRAQPPPPRWAPGTGAAAGRPLRCKPWGATGFGSSRTATPVLSAHGEELATLRVGQQVSELDRHAWLAAHPPFYNSRQLKKMPVAERTFFPMPGECLCAALGLAGVIVALWLICPVPEPRRTR